MTAVFIAVLSMSVTGTLHLIMLSLLRAAAKSAFNSTWYYYMYILAIFFLFVPIGFAGISVLSGVHGGNGRWLPSVSAAFGDAIALNEPPGLFLIMYVWLAGAVSFVVRHIVRLMLFKRRILKVSRSVKDEMKLSALNDSVSKMGIKRKLC